MISSNAMNCLNLANQLSYISMQKLIFSFLIALFGIAPIAPGQHNHTEILAQVCPYLEAKYGEKFERTEYYDGVYLNKVGTTYLTLVQLVSNPEFQIEVAYTEEGGIQADSYKKRKIEYDLEKKIYALFPSSQMMFAPTLDFVHVSLQTNKYFFGQPAPTWDLADPSKYTVDVVLHFDWSGDPEPAFEMANKAAQLIRRTKFDITTYHLFVAKKDELPKWNLLEFYPYNYTVNYWLRNSESLFTVEEIKSFIPNR